MALADAGVPMRDLVPAVASGKVENVVVCDLNKEEDNCGEADLPMAILPRTGEMLLLQMDGHLTYDELMLAMEYNKRAARVINEAQKEALRKKYSIITLQNNTITEQPPAAPPEIPPEATNLPPPEGGA